MSKLSKIYNHQNEGELILTIDEDKIVSIYNGLVNPVLKNITINNCEESVIYATIIDFILRYNTGDTKIKTILIDEKIKTLLSKNNFVILESILSRSDIIIKSVSIKQVENSNTS